MFGFCRCARVGMTKYRPVNTFRKGKVHRVGFRFFFFSFNVFVLHTRLLPFPEKRENWYSVIFPDAKQKTLHSRVNGVRGVNDVKCHFQYPVSLSGRNEQKIQPRHRVHILFNKYFVDMKTLSARSNGMCELFLALYLALFLFRKTGRKSVGYGR